MTTRTLAHKETATNEMVGAYKIKNVLPTRNIRQIDPFLLIHHMKPALLKAGENNRIPPHPHAGFEVVTYLLDGSFFHRDSKGNDVVAKGGDINWMSSGTGLMHSEGPSESMVKDGGTIQLLQVWINLPADKKKLDPTFRHYQGSGFPVTENDGSQIKVLIGSLDEKKSPVVTQTPMFFYHIKLKAGKLLTIPVEPADTAALYVLEGSLKVLNETIETGDLADFAIDGDQLVFTAVKDADLIVFGGTPIKEKMVSYGPFVMNSFEEVQDAIQRYESGAMGTLDS